MTMTEPIEGQAEELDPGTAFLLEAFDPTNRLDPYPLYARTLASQPVLDGGFGLWFALSHDAARSLLRSHKTSSDERNSNEFKTNLATDPRLQKYAATEPLMLFVDAPDHTRLRNLVARAFTPRTVEKMHPRLEQLADELLDRIDSDEPVDFVTNVAYPFPITVICELLGIPHEDVPTFQSLSDDLTLMIEPNALRSEEQEAAVDEARAALSQYIRELLDARRQSPGDDLISALLAARDGEDRLSEPELVNMVLLLLLAGHETTVNLLGNAVVALLRNPEQLARWHADPSITRSAVDELIRYDSPVQMAMRVLLEDTEVDGVVLPAGDQVITLLGSANRDPNIFDNPEQLDLTRDNGGAHMSFGGGIHHCLGMALARTEAEILLSALVARFPDLALAEEPQLRDRFVLRGYNKIMVQT